MKRPGELAIVLHTHMPYVEGGGEWPPPAVAEYMERHGVSFETALRANPSTLRNSEGFGTWPFGEEWLWEAVATCYLPLLDVLGRSPITLSLTPVLADQLEAPGALERCLRFLREIRPESHRRDIEAFHDQPELVTELERSAAEYAAAAERLAALPASDLLAKLGRHARWTSAATHAVLPLLASDSGLELQIQTGIASHRRRFGDWNGGFWLPECAHAPWLDGVLEEAGVRAVCVELTQRFGLGDERHLRPLATEAGPVLWPIDRQAISLIWSERGYPSRAAYRDYHARTRHHHRIWRTDGAPYDPNQARAQAADDAREFVTHVAQRVRNGGVCVCALDTELLGHWWYEGMWWLGEVIDEANRQGLELTTLDDATQRYEPEPAPPNLGISSWGTGGELGTWSGPRVAELAWRVRGAELRALVHPGRPSERALRELLALQASDWPFLISSDSAGPYPAERAEAHAEAFYRELEDPGALAPALRNLAPDLVGWEG